MAVATAQEKLNRAMRAEDRARRRVQLAEHIVEHGDKIASKPLRDLAESILLKELRKTE